MKKNNYVLPGMTDPIETTERPRKNFVKYHCYWFDEMFITGFVLGNIKEFDTTKIFKHVVRELRFCDNTFSKSKDIYMKEKNMPDEYMYEDIDIGYQHAYEKHMGFLFNSNVSKEYHFSTIQCLFSDINNIPATICVGTILLTEDENTPDNIAIVKSKLLEHCKKSIVIKKKAIEDEKKKSKTTIAKLKTRIKNEQRFVESCLNEITACDNATNELSKNTNFTMEEYIDKFIINRDFYSTDLPSLEDIRSCVAIANEKEDTVVNVYWNKCQCKYAIESGSTVDRVVKEMKAMAEACNNKGK